MNKVKYLLKNMGILTISNFSSKILVFLLVPLYTSVLSTSEYGLYDLAVSTATLLFPILTFNVSDAVMRFLMEKNINKNSIITIAIKFIIFSIIIFGIIMFIFYKTGLWPDIYGYEAYIFIYYVSYAINQTMIQFAKGIERVKDLGVAAVISTLVMLLGNIILLVVFKFGLIGFFASNILSQIFSALYLILKIKAWNYVVLNSLNKTLQKDMLVYSIPLIATVVGWWINSTADKYVVTFMLGVAANGLLSVSYKIPQIINTLQGIFSQAWQISAIKEYGNEETKLFYGKTFIIINFLMCISCAILILFTQPLAHILYAKDFFYAWKYVPFLLVSSVFNCASALMGPILSAKKDSKSMMLSAILGAISNVIFNVILVYFMGVQGATIATVISSYIIYAIRKIAVGKDIEVDSYYKILILWILLCLQAFIEVYIQNYFIEIIIIIIIAIMNIKLILTVIDSLKGKRIIQ